jgi:hypothetical protein
MNKKCLETKTFTKNAKPTTFQQERLLFLFEFSKISCQKLMKKDSFLATDATTQSSNQEENEARIFFFFFFFLFNCKITQQGKMLTSTKPRDRNKTLA